MVVDVLESRSGVLIAYLFGLPCSGSPRIDPNMLRELWKWGDELPSKIGPQAYAQMPPKQMPLVISGGRERG